jgi:hypothetical protein
VRDPILAIIGIILLCVICLPQLAGGAIRNLVQRVRMRRDVDELHRLARIARGIRCERFDNLMQPPPLGNNGRYLWEPFMGDVPTHNTDEPCPHCQARCVECGADGKVRCQAFGCGGRGIIVHAQKVCTALPPDQPHPKDCLCEGTKRIITQSETCPVCKGSQYAVCAPCGGTTRISTGCDNAASAAGYANREAARMAGTMSLWQWYDQAPRCGECRGTGRVQETLNADDLKNIAYAKEIVASQGKRCL